MSHHGAHRLVTAKEKELMPTAHSFRIDSKTYHDVNGNLVEPQTREIEDTVLPASEKQPTGKAAKRKPSLKFDVSPPPTNPWSVE